MQSARNFLDMEGFSGRLTGSDAARRAYITPRPPYRKSPIFPSQCIRSLTCARTTIIYSVVENCSPGRKASIRIREYGEDREADSPLTVQPWTPDHDGAHMLATPPSRVTTHDTMG